MAAEAAESRVTRSFYVGVDAEGERISALLELLHALERGTSGCLHATLCCRGREQLDDITSRIHSHLPSLNGSCLPLHADLTDDELASVVLQHQEAGAAAPSGVHVLVCSDDALTAASQMNGPTPIGTSVLINCDVPNRKRFNARVTACGAPSGVAIITLASATDSEALASLQSAVAHHIEPMELDFLHDFHRLVFDSK